MRFVISGEWTKNTLLRLIVLFFLFYTVFFWCTNWLLYFLKMGLTYDSVVTYHLGSAEKYIQPRSYQGLLEISHFHLFAMGILILTLTHLLLFVPVSLRIKGILIISSFVSALANEAAGWLIRFVNPIFAYLKIGSFLILQISLGLMIALIAYALFTYQPSAYTDSNPANKK